MTMRRLIRIVSRTARPLSSLTLGTAGGRFVYVTAAVGPVEIAVPLERAEVGHLVEVLSLWLAEGEREAAPFGRPYSAEQTAV